MPYIEAIEIDDAILDKIESKHASRWRKLKRPDLSENKHVRRDREGLYQVFGRTDAGRYLLVVLVDRGTVYGKWSPRAR